MNGISYAQIIGFSSLNRFKQKLISLIRNVAIAPLNSIIKFFTRLRTGLSLFREHELKFNFQKIVNRIEGI